MILSDLEDIVDLIKDELKFQHTHDAMDAYIWIMDKIRKVINDYTDDCK